MPKFTTAFTDALVIGAAFLICTILVAAPAIYVYQEFRPVRAGLRPAPATTLPAQEIRHDNSPAQFLQDSVTVFPALHWHDTLAHLFRDNPLLCLYLGLATGIIYIIVCGINCKLNCWRGHAKRFC